MNSTDKNANSNTNTFYSIPDTQLSYDYQWADLEMRMKENKRRSRRMRKILITFILLLGFIIACAAWEVMDGSFSSIMETILSGL